MATEQEICQVIQSRQQMVYTCQGENHVAGERYGNPHILFQTKNGHIMVHIWKIGGVRTDTTKELPDWRAYHLKDIVLLNCNGNFSPESTFNPDAKIYATTMCSV